MAAARSLKTTDFTHTILHAYFGECVPKRALGSEA